MVNPIVLGSGTPLFGETIGRIDLELFNTRTFDSGNVPHSYRPVTI
ncbi:hypothetical protein PS9374_05864 [Planomonospora sphaerica]|uniref:Deaminase n=1 Tax=Planomonospora sphaerica TaxID=161355 RepID=A0A161LL61_9ACTN|nr:hypothetical protein [Planomonospora sphaerica]GAT70184.1 hypothetical protein PS9374_05864 [Planomonospora sphaerica]